MKKIINFHDEYVDAMIILENYLKKVTLLGSFDKFTPEEENEYDTLAYAAAEYEDTIPVFPPEPHQSFEKTILIHMMDFKWKMAETATNLGISETELSEILSGKRHIDRHLKEKIHHVLDIVPQKQLETA